jgi:prepilin-type N-terminal cleavage/methylation domain-containing protein
MFPDRVTTRRPSLVAPRRISRRRRGFTLVETLVTLMITGVLLRVMLPKIDVTRYRADSVAQQLRSTFQQAQRTSLLRQHDVLVSFDTVGHRVRVVWDANNDGAVNSGERVIWRSIETGNRFVVPSAGVVGSVASSVNGTALRAVDGMPTLVFHRDGSVSTDAEIYLVTAGQAAAAGFRAVLLIQATGRSEWYRQSSGTGKWIRASL